METFSRIAALVAEHAASNPLPETVDELDAASRKALTVEARYRGLTEQELLDGARASRAQAAVDDPIVRDAVAKIRRSR
jgi:hypothetical protein